MTTSSGVAVNRAIVHIVDPHGAGGFQLSSRELALDGMVREFVVDHIVRSLADSASRAACFVRTSRSSSLKDLVEALREGRVSFLSASRTIAQRLHLIVREDRRISGAAIAVCE